MISIGTIGLIKAASTFDYDKGTRFATYASRCIENEILMHFRNLRKSSQDVFISDPMQRKLVRFPWENPIIRKPVPLDGFIWDQGWTADPLPLLLIKPG